MEILCCLKLCGSVLSGVGDYGEMSGFWGLGAGNGEARRGCEVVALVGWMIGLGWVGLG